MLTRQGLMSEPQPDLEPPQHGLYMLFLLVLVFFLMGLVGFMICHVLKKKGYRCRTSRGSEPDDAQLQPPEDDDMNEDTVERIVRCIIQNEGGCRLSPCPPPPQLSLALAFASTDPFFSFSPQPTLRP